MCLGIPFLLLRHQFQTLPAQHVKHSLANPTCTMYLLDSLALMKTVAVPRLSKLSLPGLTQTIKDRVLRCLADTNIGSFQRINFLNK